MRTVKEMKEELSKFEDDDLCFAYEGEVTGLIIRRSEDTCDGVIHCSEDDRDKRHLTRLIR